MIKILFSLITRNDFCKYIYLSFIFFESYQENEIILLKIKLISFFETHDFGNTIPLIFKAKIGLSLTLVVIVIVFLNGPCLFVS